MKNGLSTLQKYFRVQRVVAILFFLMMVVSLLLPYAKLLNVYPIKPGTPADLHIVGYQLRFAIYSVFPAFICMILLILGKNNVSAIIALLLATLIGINLFYLPESIWFKTLDYAIFPLDHFYQTGFYLMMISGIGLIITALTNAVIVIKMPSKKDLSNSDLIDDL